ncbi:2316_t:CDS:1 [Funneliformis geosporum]|uniref:13287_t:CDS:1 n=1 Tax=Funneliformis geosporum TaxID=1117311 RepID=A0A9W4WUW6_9GLOM|nr:13287_t:CDS:1 [Funneliformis geosporum]CAI2166189.1 2316_t:CDS:1 [Funneliformis geosporum]
MSQRPLIEFLKELTTDNDDMRIYNALLERCLNTSISDLEKFNNKLSQLLRDFPDIYIPTLQTLISYLCDESSRKKTLRQSLRERWNTAISNFISSLITAVIMQNLDHSDFPGFGELLHDCIELIWKVQNVTLTSHKGYNLAFQTTKSFFNAILNAGVLGILITDPSGRRCIKRILFDFNMIKEIEREELLRAIDLVAAIVEKCSEHEKDSPNLSEWFSIYKACTSLLESLRKFKNMEKNQLINKKGLPPPTLDDMIKLDNKESRTNRKQFVNSLMVNSNSLPVSTQDERHLTILGMKAPQKLSVLPNFLQAIEQRKIDSFRVSVIVILFYCAIVIKIDKTKFKLQLECNAILVMRRLSQTSPRLFFS